MIAAALLTATRARSGSLPPPVPIGIVTAPITASLNGAGSFGAQVTPSRPLEIPFAPSPAVGVSWVTAIRANGASVGVALYEARKVEATVTP
jgi:hypothetical protein